MLLELMVENYAVIERLRLRLHAGLNLLTGETGSGKSIVVDALGLLFGGRADAELVRSGAERARLSGIFEAPDHAALRALLEESGISAEDGELLVEREILSSGKSRAFAGGRPVTLALLRALAPHLGDIHGQHDQQELFEPAAQREMLDSFAGVEELTGEAADLYRRWRECASEIEELDRSEQERLRMADLWAFQRREIEVVAPQKGEDLALEEERRVLGNVARLQEAAAAAYTALYDAPESAVAGLRASIRRLEELCRIDSRLADSLESLRPTVVALEEAAHAVRDYLGRLEADPGRLEEVELRLAALDKLKRKYGVTIEEVLEFLDSVRRNLEASESAGERQSALAREREKLAAAYAALAARLSERRRTAARKLEKRMEAELGTLAMERTAFRVSITTAEWSENGADAVQFLVSPNVGEEPRPLDKVASGGELSRIALALRTCSVASRRGARESSPRTLVFDEVDAGIGGAAAETVGRRLKQLAASHQVLCVTHLAQIAGFADHHYFVEKREVKGRTVATVEELAGEARVREIGRMLAGQRLTPEALRHAEQLLAASAGE